MEKERKLKQVSQKIPPNPAHQVRRKRMSGDKQTDRQERDTETETQTEREREGGS